MFLERKFSRRDPDLSRSDPPLCPALPAADWSSLPEVVYDVICNLQLLLAARRGYSHVFADFGLSASNGQQGLDARLDEVDVDVDDEGAPSLKLSGALPAAPGLLVFRFGIISRKILSFEYTPGPDA